MAARRRHGVCQGLLCIYNAETSNRFFTRCLDNPYKFIQPRCCDIQPTFASIPRSREAHNKSGTEITKSYRKKTWGWASKRQHHGSPPPPPGERDGLRPAVFGEKVLIPLQIGELGDAYLRGGARMELLWLLAVIRIRTRGNSGGYGMAGSLVGWKGLSGGPPARCTTASFLFRQSGYF